MCAHCKRVCLLWNQNLAEKRFIAEEPSVWEVILEQIWSKTNLEQIYPKKRISEDKRRKRIIEQIHFDISVI